MSATNNPTAISSRGSNSNDDESISMQSISTFYHRDPKLPFWRSNSDVDQIFESFAHRSERAQSWLRYRNVSESCFGFEQAVMMRGHFELGMLGYHTYTWTYTPTHTGGQHIVLPVYHDCRMVDLLAINRLDHTVWGATTGAGQYLGNIGTPLRIHRSPANWLANDCEGILPLSKAFFPLLQNAPSIIAEDDEHAWDLAYRVYRSGGAVWFQPRESRRTGLRAD